MIPNNGWGNIGENPNETGNQLWGDFANQLNGQQPNVLPNVQPNVLPNVQPNVQNQYGAQQFIPDVNATYKIVTGLDKSKCLDCCQNKFKMNQLVLNPFSGAKSQAFKINMQNGKYYIICPLNNGTI
jgi:hypothetical protein